jgi:DNA-binding CsgD family transcriptional regulator
VAAISPERLRDDLTRLAHRDCDVREFSRAAAGTLHRAVEFDGFCLLTLDPATLLPTGEVVENGLPPAATSRLAKIEVAEEDFNKFGSLARAERPVASLSESTGGDLDRSLRHREVRAPHGLGDELRAALVRDESTWGGLTLMRDRGRPRFTPRETSVVAAVARQLAEGLRRAIVRQAVSAPDSDGSGETGVIVLEPDDSIALTNSAAEAWLEQLADGGSNADRVPGPVAAVATRARSVAGGHAAAEASARVATATGPWLLLSGSVLGDGPDARSVVVIEPARAPELAPLIADAYELTDRERTITQLVAHGFDTAAIAGRLNLSPWTVQDHLKSIFEKTATGSRGELVARLFFDHYAPRLARS